MPILCTHFHNKALHFIKFNSGIAKPINYRWLVSSFNHLMHKRKEKTFWSRGNQTPVSNEQAPQANALSITPWPFSLKAAFCIFMEE